MKRKANECLGGNVKVQVDRFIVSKPNFLLHWIALPVLKCSPWRFGIILFIYLYVFVCIYIYYIGPLLFWF